MNPARVAAGAPSPLAQAEALAFRVGGVGYRWADVFAYARQGGDWQILDAEVRQALACLRLADGEGTTMTREQERATERAFRRARRLHAAEDLEAWLAERDLTVAQWRRYIRGQALRRHHAAELDTVVARHPPSGEALRAALPVWGWCSGALPRWAGELATRAAAAHAACERDAAGAPPGLEAGAPPGLEVGAPPAPADLDAHEERYDRFAGEVATPERLEALVAARYLDWLRVDCDVVVFADRDTAAEALACVRDDGWSLEEAARAGGAGLARRSLLVEEVDADLRHHIVAARDGDLLGPLALDGGSTLVRVRRKHAPSLEDGELRARATRELVARAAAREVDDRVQWLHPR